MTAPLFRHHILSQDWVPSWVTGPNRGRILYAIGLTLDRGAQWCQLGVLERFPLVCSEEALTWIGRDRGIRRGFAESSESYRIRLVRWRRTWARAGSPWAILENVQAYFLPEMPVVRLVTHSPALNRADWFTRDAQGAELYATKTPSNFDWDSADAGRPGSLDIRDTRFWVVIYQDPVTSIMARRGPSASQDTRRMRGTAALVNVGVDLFDMAMTFKMAGSWCAGVIACWDPAAFSPAGSGAGYPDGTWHHHSRIVSPSVREPNRFRDARYMHSHRYPGSWQDGLTSEVG